MPRIERSRDLIVLVKGDTVAVAVNAAMATSGWPGGQGVQWTTSPKDELTVTTTDGSAQGFMLWGSDEVSDQYTGMTRAQPTYRYGVMGYGGWIFCTRNFESSTYASRVVPPNSPLTYQADDPLFFSLTGKFTNEDEWTLSGDPRAPNTNVVGIVVQPPSAFNDFYLTVHLRT